MSQVLAQDQAQVSQSSNILAEREYQAKLSQYNKNIENYDKELAEYEAQVEAEKSAHREVFEEKPDITMKPMLDPISTL